MSKSKKKPESIDHDQLFKQLLTTFFLAKSAQRAKKVKVHFKPLLRQALSNLTGQLSIVQNLIPYLDFMHYESCKGSRIKKQY